MSEQAQEILEREFGGRQPDSPLTGWLIFAVGVGWSLFQLWAVWDGTLNPQRLGAIHLAFALALIFLAFPSKGGPKNRIPLYDWLLTGAGLAATLHIVWNYDKLVSVQGGLPVSIDIWMGSLLIFAMVLAAYRTLGLALPIIAGLTVIYALSGPAGVIPLTPPDIIYLHNGYNWSQVLQQLYVTSEGIWGTPIQVSATFVFLFVLFGALLDKAGAGRYFVDLAYASLGTLRGGPAKAAVVSSMLTGVISGSSTANVVTTGTFTIPLMRRTGYSAVKAGAIEVAASVNGQLMPPVMGAAAFIMASFLNIPYSQLIIHALVPAVLAYAGLFFVVHLEALKLGLKGVPRAELPPLFKTFIGGVHYFIPVIFLLYQLMWVHLTPERSALNALGVLLVLIIIQDIWRSLRDGTGLFAGLRAGVTAIVLGLEQGARNMTTIAVATAMAGIVVGMVTMTNLGYGLTQIIGAISFGNIWAVLVLAAIASLILGMGLPTTANYIVMAALVAPIITQIAGDSGIVVSAVAVHLFVFYFGILADDTPPVGVAAYAAAAISGADPIRTGIQGFTYDMRTAILPFIFFFNPALLLIGIESWVSGALTITTAFIGMLAFVAATQGYLLHRMGWIERILLLAASIAMITPGLVTDIAGVAVLAGVIALQYWQRGRGVQA